MYRIWIRFIIAGFQDFYGFFGFWRFDFDCDCESCCGFSGFGFVYCELLVLLLLLLVQPGPGLVPASGASSYGHAAAAAAAAGGGADHHLGLRSVRLRHTLGRHHDQRRRRTSSLPLELLVGQAIELTLCGLLDALAIILHGREALARLLWMLTQAAQQGVRHIGTWLLNVLDEIVTLCVLHHAIELLSNRLG